MTEIKALLCIISIFMHENFNLKGVYHSMIMFSAVNHNCYSKLAVTASKLLQCNTLIIK